MRARSYLTMILAFSALASVACTAEVDGEVAPDEEVASVTEALDTVSGWTPWSSGSCGFSGCTTIVEPKCANGSFATGWQSTAQRGSWRLFCRPGPSATTNHVWTTNCPADKVATGLSCITNQFQQFCGPVTLRCSTPVGWAPDAPSQPATLTGTHRYACHAMAGVTGVGSVDSIAYTGGVCSSVYAPLRL